MRKDRLTARQKRFFCYYKPYLGLLTLDILCAFVVSAIALALPLCVNLITRNAVQGNDPAAFGRIGMLGALMLGLVAMQAACNTFVDYQGHMMGSLMERDMRRDLFEQYQRLSFRFYDEQRTGQLMTRLTGDLFSLSELYHHGPEDVAVAIVKALGVFAILLTIDVELTVVVFIFVPIMAVYALYFNSRMQLALRMSKDRIGDINAQVEDTLAGIRTVQSFTAEGFEATKFAYENSRFIDSRREGYKNEAYFYEGMQVFSHLMTIVVIIVGSLAIARASLDLADLLTAIFCVGILVEPIQRLVNVARLFQEGSASFNRFMDIMELGPEICDTADAIELSEVRGDLAFKGVSFKYEDDRTYILKDISLAIRAGEYIALVGSSGVGKTTLCSLIPRFYDVNQGAILIDGMDIRSVRLCSLRQNIGIVQQDVYLFAGTVADNIRYGKLDASDAEVVAAARKANAHEFITALPNGYDTSIGQRGVKLSGGQKQRLSIARVFLKDPPILLFDEATSALDNESERAIRESLEQLADNRTTLVIAHRLSTIRNAQRIIVLTDNGICEQGTHDELIAYAGAYANLYALQLKL